MRYDHPNAVVRRETHVVNRTGIASATHTKVLFFQKAKLIAVHSLVTTAGTNASAGDDIYIGTTSVGAITQGTDAANTVNTSGAINSDISANSYVDIRGKANSATKVNSYVLEYEVYHDASQTAEA